MADSESTNEAVESEKACGIACHRALLAAASPYFNAMFTPAMIESKQSCIRLKGIDEHSLRALVDYMYTGQLMIDEHNVQNLLTTGSLLQVLFRSSLINE
ncbi:unnamed protein product [Anisakis simplex]|uniref:BTB domain-containing protein n=1 Tax=Anisakis simplex TaxID=6269 RepID=A0A0M3JIA0_ANISI|nr:unnamed protein product [Anisakis simplex]